MTVLHDVRRVLCERLLVTESLHGSDRTEATGKGVGRCEPDGAVCQRTLQ